MNEPQAPTPAQDDAQKQAPLAESGEPITVAECRRCNKKDAKGISWIRDTDGSLIFKCDSCGKKMFMGKTEEAHNKNIGSIEHMDAFDTARAKTVREDDAQVQEQEHQAVQEQGGAVEKRKLDEMEVRGRGFFWASFMGIPGAPSDYTETPND